MKALRIITRSVLTASVLLSTVSFSSGGEGPVTPYGAYCKDCTVYGSCSVLVPLDAAMHSLDKYYEERGYRLGTVVVKGKFIAAEILQNDKVVDKVLFDRKTARIRSIY